MLFLEIEIEFKLKLSNFLLWQMEIPLKWDIFIGSVLMIFNRVLL
jgi:hypothetical protein